MLWVNLINSDYFAKLVLCVVDVDLVYKVDKPSEVIIAAWCVQEHRFHLKSLLNTVKCRVC